MTKVTISEELAEFRAGFPGCFTVAFADLSTGMVLASSTSEKTTQERLDALCERATTCLSSAETAGFVVAFGRDRTCQPTLAWQAELGRVHCFIKLPHPAAEALCCVASMDVPLDKLSTDAAYLLTRLASEG